MRRNSTLSRSLTIAAGLALVLVATQPATAQVVKVEVGVAGMT